MPFMSSFSATKPKREAGKSFHNCVMLLLSSLTPCPPGRQLKALSLDRAAHQPQLVSLATYTGQNPAIEH